MTARCSEFADAERRWAFARALITKGLDLPQARPGKAPTSATTSSDHA